jgi:tetratricopeptide (TPR) repeat protein
VIRVFISSTFRDMFAEREELVKRVFPRLRKLCEQRGVVWGEVDLRWGVTGEEQAEGKVLPICLEEIRRCRPYFVGLLGERYGWVPEEISPELVALEPWLGEHRHRSVTELEILHGVLNNPEMAEHAFFYLRDPTFLDTLPPEQQPQYRESDPQRAEQLRRLKAELRASRFPVREDYSDAHALGELVLADLQGVIDRLFPEATAPDPLAREAAEHEGIAESRARVYIGRPEYFSRLDGQVHGEGPPLVVIGESGVGKSALLANWALRYREQHRDEPVIMHFIGASASSANWAALVRRLLGEFQHWFGIERDIPTQPDDLRGVLDDWLPYVAAAGRVVLVLDGLDQLEPRDRAQELGWLPRVLPPKVRLVVSALPGPALEETARRGWPTFEVERLEPDERAALLQGYLGQYRKSLNPAQTHRIVSVPQTANPLYLRTLLEELRVFGIYEQLEARITDYLSAPDPEALFEKVLARWEEDYDRERPGLVRESLSLIWGARFGLSEAELLDLLGKGGNPLPRAAWSPLYLAAEQALAQRSGRLTFFHRFLRDAVASRYLSAEEEKRAVYQRLADYFDHPDRGERRLEEVPWQLREAQEWERLLWFVTDIPTFLGFRRRDEYEPLGYCLSLPSGYNWERELVAAEERWEQHQGDAEERARGANLAGNFLCTAGRYAGAEPLHRRALAIREKALGPEHPDTAESLNNLASLLYEKGDYAEAEPLYRRALAIRERALGPEHPDAARSLTNLALALHARGDYAAAEPLYRQALTADEQALGMEHPETARSLNSLACLLQATGDNTGAELLCRRVLAIAERVLGPEHPSTAMGLHNLAYLLRTQGDHAGAEPLCRRALAIREKALGPEHRDTATSLYNLAHLLKATGDYAEAEPLYRRVLAIREKALGPEHPEIATILNRLALLLDDKGDYAGAEPLYRRALAIREQVLGPEHPEIATILNSLALLLDDKGDYAGAEPLYRRALTIREKALGPEHPDTAQSLSNLAGLLRAKGACAEAEPLCRRALAIREQALGPEHPSTATSLNNLAYLLKAKGDYAEAEPLYRRALAIREQVLGPEHPDTATSLNNLAYLLRSQGDHAGAEPLYRRALAIREQVLGPEHPDTAISLLSLAWLRQERGDSKEAERLAGRARTVFEEALGPEHPGAKVAAEVLARIRASRAADAG